MTLLARARIDGHETYGEVEGDRFQPLTGGLTDHRAEGDPVALGDVELLAPTAPRSMLMTMGGFMPADGSPLPPNATPWLVPKLTTSVGGDNAVVVVPTYVTTIWIEIELAIVIGKTIHNATPDEARDAILGYTIFNDVSAPQYLFDVATMTPQPQFDIWRAKSLDTFAVMGPWIRTDLTEADVAAGLELTTTINGEVAGGGNTKNHKFPMSTWVSFASHHVTLGPGDVISLGTPAPCVAAPGDSVTLEVEGVGVLHNSLVSGV